MLPYVALAKGPHFALVVLASQNHPPVPGDIEKGRVARRSIEDPLATPKIDGENVVTRETVPGGVPDLLSVGRPGEPRLGVLLGRQRPLLPGPVHDRERAPVVETTRMVEERDERGVARDTGMGDPTERFVENPSDGKLQPVASLRLVNNGEILAVGRPVGVFDALEDLSGGSAGERRDGERSNREVEKGSTVAACPG